MAANMTPDREITGMLRVFVIAAIISLQPDMDISSTTRAFGYAGIKHHFPVMIDD
jgi:hypothetical protein